MRATLLLQKKDNPTWEMTDGEKHQLYVQLRILPGTLDLPDYGKTDYQGVEVNLDDYVIKCYKGIVEIISRNEVFRLMDYDRELEEWIFRTSEKKIHELAFVRISLGEFSKSIKKEKELWHNE